LNKNSKVINILLDMGQIALEIKQKIQERIKKGEKVAELSR
jgi:methionine aminopeptidase